MDKWNHLEKGKLYRISRTIETSLPLHGRMVQFDGYRPANGYDIRRAIVRIVNQDGSLGETYYVHQSMVIPF